MEKKSINLLDNIPSPPMNSVKYKNTSTEIITNTTLNRKEVERAMNLVIRDAERKSSLRLEELASKYPKLAKKAFGEAFDIAVKDIILALNEGWDDRIGFVDLFRPIFERLIMEETKLSLNQLEHPKLWEKHQET